MSDRPPVPPFDGKPCPACPMEIRNLAAVAHNLLNRWDMVERGGDACARAKFRQKLEDLRDAVKQVQPLMDAHFADPRHSHGEGLR